MGSLRTRIFAGDHDDEFISCVQHKNAYFDLIYYIPVPLPVPVSVAMSVDLQDANKLLEQACVFRVYQNVPQVCVREGMKGGVLQELVPILGLEQRRTHLLAK